MPQETIDFDFKNKNYTVSDSIIVIRKERGELVCRDMAGLTIKNASGDELQVPLPTRDEITINRHNGIRSSVDLRTDENREFYLALIHKAKQVLDAWEKENDSGLDDSYGIGISGDSCDSCEWCGASPASWTNGYCLCAQCEDQLSG